MSFSVDLSTPDRLRAQVGKEVFLTEWVTVDQRRIDLFAQATDDF